MNKQKRCREIFRLSEEMPVQYICRVIFFFFKKGSQTCDTVSLTQAGNLPRVEQAAVWGRDIADSLQNTVLQASIKTTFEKCKLLSHLLYILPPALIKN